MKNQYNVAAVFALVFMLLVSVQTTVAATVRVPSESATIGAALAVTTCNDTILVAPGTYSGPGFYDLDFEGKPRVLMSEGGSEVTTLDGLGTDRIFYAGT